MGTFTHTIEVAAAEAGPFIPVDTIVDTGATYTSLPRSVLRRLGVTPRGRRTFLLADGRPIERELAAVAVRLEGEIQQTLCIVGDEETPPLLGAFTLEGFGLGVDPINRRLVRLPYQYLLSLPVTETPTPLDGRRRLRAVMEWRLSWAHSHT